MRGQLSITPEQAAAGWRLSPKGNSIMKPVQREPDTGPLGASARPSGKPWSEKPKDISVPRRPPLEVELMESGSVALRPGWIRIGQRIVPDPAVTGWTTEHDRAEDAERRRIALEAADTEEDDCHG